jgi:hypothetical protein
MVMRQDETHSLALGRFKEDHGLELAGVKGPRRKEESGRM